MNIFHVALVNIKAISDVDFLVFISLILQMFASIYVFFLYHK